MSNSKNLQIVCLFLIKGAVVATFELNATQDEVAKNAELFFYKNRILSSLAERRSHPHNFALIIYKPIFDTKQTDESRETFTGVYLEPIIHQYSFGRIWLFEVYEESKKIIFFELSITSYGGIYIFVRYLRGNKLYEDLCEIKINELDCAELIELLHQPAPSWQIKHIKVFAHILKFFENIDEADIFIFCIYKYISNHLTHRAVLLDNPDSPYKELSSAEVEGIMEIVRKHYKKHIIEHHFATKSIKQYVIFKDNLISFAHGYAKAFGVFLKQKLGHREALKWLYANKDSFAVGVEDSIKKGIQAHEIKERTKLGIEKAETQFVELLNKLNRRSGK